MKWKIFMPILFFVFQLHAQDKIGRGSINSGGDTKFVDNSYFSWSVGEAVVGTVSNNVNILTQGFQQPDQKSAVATEELKEKIEVIVYPNPSKDYLDVVFKGDLSIETTFKVYNILGQEVVFYKDRPVGQTVHLDISHIPMGTYILQISQTDKRDFIAKVVVEK